METLVNTLDFLFGCHHSHLSRVFTIEGRTYRVCCDCGAKFKYSLATMRTERRLSALDAQQVTIWQNQAPDFGAQLRPYDHI